jgi:hypothetical protein
METRARGEGRKDARPMALYALSVYQSGDVRGRPPPSRHGPQGRTTPPDAMRRKQRDAEA